jgi:hypothetical protein
MTQVKGAEGRRQFKEQDERTRCQNYLDKMWSLSASPKTVGHCQVKGTI